MASNVKTQNKVAEHLQRIKTLFSMQEYEKAQQLLLQLENSGYIPVLILLGNIFERLGEPHKAVDQYKKVLKLDSNNGEAFNNLGIIHKNMRLFPEALLYFNKAQKILGFRADIHYNIGNTYKGSGNLVRALEEFEKALKVDPNFINTYINMGTVLEEMGNMQQALKTYSKGLEIDPNNPNIHYNLGVLYKTQSKLKQAEIEFRQALKTKPGWSEAQNNLGVVLFQAGRLGEAEKTFKNILRFQADDTKALNNMGVIQSRLNHFDEAKTFFRKALEMDPNYTEAVFNIGALYEQQGYYTDALTEFENLVKLKPHDHSALLNLGTAYFNLERYEDAIRQFNKILDSQPENIKALQHLAQVYTKLGKYTNAADCYKHILQTDPYQKTVNVDLAAVYKESGQFDQAEKLLKEYLELDPTNLRARLLQADIYTAKNFLKHALQILIETVKLYPESIDALYKLAQAYLAMGETEKAISTFENLITLQKNRGSEKDLEKLQESLVRYEKAVHSYEQKHRDKWLENIKKLTYPPQPSAAEGKLKLPLKPDMNSTTPRMEEESVPIINIGMSEPIFKVEEEEEVLRLEENDEEIIAADPSVLSSKPEIVEIQDDTIPLLTQLLKDQLESNREIQEELRRAAQLKAEQNHQEELDRLKQLPAQERPAVPPPPANYPPPPDSQQLYQQPPLQQQMPAQIQMQPYPVQITPPIQIIQPPAAGPPTQIIRQEMTGGDEVKQDTELIKKVLNESFAHQKKIFEDIKEDIRDVISTIENLDREAKKRTIKVNPPFKVFVENTLPQQKPQVMVERIEEPQYKQAARPSMPAKTQPPAAPRPAKRKPAPPADRDDLPFPIDTLPDFAQDWGEPQNTEQKPTSQDTELAGLFDYLGNLVKYLPKNIKTDYKASDLRLKMNLLTSKFQGKPGLKSKIEKKQQSQPLSRSDISQTLEALRNICGPSNDEPEKGSIKERIEHVLDRLKE